MDTQKTVTQSDIVLDSLIELVASIDEAELHDLDLPLVMPGLLEHFLEPDIQATLPETLHQPAAIYLAGLPGYRQGDVKRATEQHTLRLELWMGDAQIVDEVDIELLGLQAEEEISDG